MPLVYFSFARSQYVKALICLIAFVLLLGCDVEDNSKASQHERHLIQAAAYHEQGQYGAAIIEARNAIQSNPQDPRGHVILAKILNELGSSRQAITQLEQLEIDDNVDYLFTLIEAYGLRGKYKSALQLLDTKQRLLKKHNAPEFDNKKARILAASGKLNEALTTYKKLLTANEKHVEALLGIAEVYVALDERDLADPYLIRVDQLDPDNIEALIFKAKLAVINENFAKGETYLTRALTLLPNTDHITPQKVNVLGALAEILTQQGRSSEALVYTRLLSDELAGSIENQTKYRDAITLYKQGQYEASERILKEVIKESPAHELAGQLLGVINYIQGDLAEAEDYFSRNLDPEIGSVATKRVFAMTSLKLNKPEEVLRLLEDDIEDTRDVNLLGLYGLAALSNQEYSKGISILNKALALDPSKSRIHLLLANYYNSDDALNYDRALVHVRQAYKTSSFDPFIQRALVRQYLLMNKRGEARKLVDEVLSKFGNAFSSKLLAGDFARSGGNKIEALRYYLDAQQLAPEEAGPLASLGRINLQLRKYDDAEVAFKKLITLIPSNLQAYQGLLTASDIRGTLSATVEELTASQVVGAGELTEAAPFVAIAHYYSRKGDLEKAKYYEAKVKKFAPDEPYTQQLSASIHYAEALLYRKAANYDKARISSLEGLKYSPSNRLLLTLLAEIEVLARNFGDAQRVIEQIAAQNEAVGKHLQGDLFSARKELDRAIEAYEAAWALAKNDVLAVKIYRLLLGLKRQDEAERFLSSWIEAIPRSTRARSILATDYISKNKLDDARTQLEIARSLSPSSPTILNNLAWVYQELGHSDALSVAKRANDVAPNNPAILDTYGWILYKNGKHQLALAKLSRASELAPNNIDIQAHLDTVKATLSR